MSDGKMFYAKIGEEYRPIGTVTEINTITESPTPEPPLVHIADDTGLTVTVTLTKKDKKVWAKILNMPKFALTEWIFPRKKKRGTKRLIRKVERQVRKLERHPLCFQEFTGVCAECMLYFNCPYMREERKRGES